MYRCTECREEFKEKPEYCNCGNDEFEKIPDIVTATVSQKSTQKESSPSEKHSMPNLSSAKVFSITFFCFCIILAIVPWLIKTEKPKHTPQKVEKTVNVNIPDIDKFWNDTPKTVEKPEPVKIEQPEPIAPKQETKPVTAPAKPIIKKPQQQKPQAKPKTEQKQKPQPTQVQKPAQTQPVTQPPKLPQSVLNPTSTPQATQPPAQTVQQPTPKPEPPQMDSEEFLKYKGAIRNALLAKLNLTAIQGSGDCAIEFSLDNSGKLLNRNFIYKSQNKTLNDEVYLMLMRLPYYKQPPAHYNGEKIKLKFYINNGYYEITFI